MTFLLDLNLLLALAWPSHVHHELAHGWFEGERSPRWATCPLTQLGFIRLSSNPAFTTDAVAPGAALAMLRAMAAMDGHEFWPNEIDCVGRGFGGHLRIAGHRQVTDALSVLTRPSSLRMSRDARPPDAPAPAEEERSSPHLRVIETG